jgi:chromosome partitioning protein
MRRVVFNQKGGVGKSSITVNLAAISAAKGLKTLVVDLDAQSNATHYVLGDRIRHIGDQTIARFFLETLSFKLLAQKPRAFVHDSDFENLYVIPASAQLGDLQAQLESKHKIYKLRDLLRSLDDFDAVYIDTPPAFNFYTLSALIAANACLIPFDCDQFSRLALYTLLENVEETRSDHNPRLTVEGIIVNQFQPRASFPQRVVEELRAEGLPILNSFLSSSVKMRESHNEGKPLLHMAPKHKLTEEYMALFDELHPHMVQPDGREALNEAEVSLS